ncbi:UNVERIFIED_CONTAM: hypothetical protein HDU68_001532 [Siphonaria sp. JEL0065]|nr:hypothetical protein HDU68_001532 [Siphonaria sp. JEL0065]
MLVALVLASVAVVNAQFDPKGPTQTGPYGKLPKGCLGSYPNIGLCIANGFYLGANAVDFCAPPKPWPVPGQLVYIKNEQNFCINLPDPDSIYLQNNYYKVGKYPSIVEAEGYVRSFCLGDYLPPGSLKLPKVGIKAAHVLKNSTDAKNPYMQVHGYLDCDVLKINCTQSFPGAFDNAGQYDNVGYAYCGKEPYSGVDLSAGSGHVDYVEQAGDGLFCMRTCAAHTGSGESNCPVTKDTVGCVGTMGVTFKDGWSYTETPAASATSAGTSGIPSTSASESASDTTSVTASASSNVRTSKDTYGVLASSAMSANVLFFIGLAGLSLLL